MFRWDFKPASPQASLLRTFVKAGGSHEESLAGFSQEALFMGGQETWGEYKVRHVNTWKEQPMGRPDLFFLVAIALSNFKNVCSKLFVMQLCRFPDLAI